MRIAGGPPLPSSSGPAPEEVGLERAPLEVLKGGDAKAAEITRRELAEQVDVDMKLIDSIEHGTAKVPAALYPDFASVFGIDAHEFAKTCLMYENPSAYEVLFGALPQELSAAA